MRFFKGVYKKKIKPIPQYRNLNMGLIKQYSMIIPKDEIEKWKLMGWVEDKSFRDFDYCPDTHETVILSRPKTLLDIEIEKLKGKQILDYSTHLGSYGMGGPGFFGVLINNDEELEYIVYAVWASDQYIMMDNRVIGCHINFNSSYHPWISRWTGEDEDNQWDDLTDLLIGSTISGVFLSETQFVIEIMCKGQNHTIIFYKYNEELPPHGNGDARKPAFADGPIGNYIVFCNKNALLHV